MILTIANICCFIYYTISTVQTIPTIVRIIRYKESTDISLISTYLGIISCTAWTTYIFLTPQTTLVYIGSAWDCVVVAVYSIVVIKYHKDNPFKKFKKTKNSDRE